MHLKKLTIKGYKTYRDLTTIVDLHAGVNVLVGLNGSGKSNIFSAIRFALGGDGVSKEQQRRAMLHESQGQQVASAFVEVTFDNSDGKIPVDKAEVVLRRTITINTDVYEWNGKEVTKAEVDSWLEGAGISNKHNTYSIVENGKVTALTQMSDAKRLDLLKEVSGAHIYDERRAESLAVLETTRKKREHIAEVMDDIRGKLDRLDEEQKELQEARALSRERVAIESVIADREKRQCRERIKELEQQASAILAELGGEQGVMTDMSAEVGREKSALEELTKELTETSTRLRFLSKRREKLSTEHAELCGASEGRDEAVEKNTAEMEELRGRLERANEELDDVTTAIKSKKAQLQSIEEEQDSLRSELAVATRKREKLAVKKGSGPSYASVAERNEYLSEKVASKNQRLEEVEGLLGKQTAQLDEEQQEIDRIGAEIARLEAESQAYAGQNGDADIATTERNIADTQDEIRQKMKEINALREEEESFSRQRQELLEAVWRTAPRAVREGYTWLMESGIDGVHGLLIEHVDILEQYRLCVEVTGGLSLFNILVDDDKVGEECLSFIREKQAEIGKPLRITLTPLEQVRIINSDVSYPRGEVANILPLVDVIESPDWARCAVEQVWRRHVLVPDLELGAKLADFHLDAVTEGGDTSTWRGVMKGGYTSPERYTRLRDWYHAEELEVDINRNRERIAEAEKQVQQLRTTERELQEHLVDLRCTAQAQLNAQSSRLRQVTEDREAVHRLENSLELAAKLKREYEAEREQLELDIIAIRAEMKTKKLPSGALTVAEAQQLEKLEEEIEEKGHRLTQITEEAGELADAIARLRDRESLLIGMQIPNLQKELKDVEMNCTEATIIWRERQRRRQWLAGELAEIEQELALREERRAELEESIVSKSKSVEDMEQEVAESERSILKLKESYNEKQNEITDYEEKFKIADAKLDEIVAELSGSVERIEDETKKIGEGVTIRQLQRRAMECRGELEKYPLVNNKALEQFAQFDGQYKELLRSQEEMDQGQVAIDELIAKLDGEKDNNIIKSFAQVNEHFAATFRELVPGGTVKMRLLKRDPSPGLDEGEDEEEEEHHIGAAATVDEKYAGVSIEVMFAAGTTNMRRMHELSGSQKSVVAVALLFAILRSEQPPLYLLDEIDSALDAQYREAFARLISSVTNPNPLGHRPPPPAQVICSTCRPEICHISDRCYEVSLENRSSRVTLLSDFQRYFAQA